MRRVRRTDTGRMDLCALASIWIALSHPAAVGLFADIEERRTRARDHWFSVTRGARTAERGERLFHAAIH